MRATGEVLHFIVTSDTKNSELTLVWISVPTSMSTKSCTAMHGPVTAASLGALSSYRYPQPGLETQYKL